MSEHNRHQLCPCGAPECDFPHHTATPGEWFKHVSTRQPEVTAYRQMCGFCDRDGTDGHVHEGNLLTVINYACQDPHPPLTEEEVAEELRLLKSAEIKAAFAECASRFNQLCALRPELVARLVPDNARARVLRLLQRTVEWSTTSAKALAPGAAKLVPPTPPPVPITIVPTNGYVLPGPTVIPDGSALVITLTGDWPLWWPLEPVEVDASKPTWDPVNVLLDTAYGAYYVLTEARLQQALSGAARTQALRTLEKLTAWCRELLALLDAANDDTVAAEARVGT